jgi:hypothetical protein
VATTADSYSVKRASAKAPISSHPAFPAIVAMWFAALLGIGSLVLPLALVERVVSITGLASLFDAAAPPLGFTARVAIALAGATAGALAGLMLARKVAEAHTPEPRARNFKSDDARPCRPIRVHDELDEEGLEGGGDTAPSHKRRTLAIAEDNARSAYLQAAPVPGFAADEPLAMSALGFASPALDLPDETEGEPLELAAFADFGAIADGESETPGSATNAALDALLSRARIPDDPTFQQDPPMTDRPSSEIPESFETAPGAADPLPFAAPSLRRAPPIAFDEDEVEDLLLAPVAEEPPVPHLAIIEDIGEPQAADDRPLAELGLVQLAARLGASLAKRKARQAAHQPSMAPAAVPLAGGVDFEAAEPADAARAIAHFFDPEQAIEPAGETPVAEVAPPHIAVPASFQAWPAERDDEVDDEDLAASFSLPLTAAAEAERDEDDSAETDEPGEDADYSSLLAMKNPFARQQEFVRVEEPDDHGAAIEPAVTFPSPAQVRSTLADQDGLADPFARPFDAPKNPAKTAVPAATALQARDPADAERNLREALATLQRMSGAA